MVEKISIVIVSQNKRLTDLLTLYFNEISDCEIKGHFFNTEGVFETVNSLDESILFVDTKLELDDLVEHISIDCPKCKIVAIKENPDISFIINVIRKGVKEILGYPIIKSEFSDIVERIRTKFNETYQKQDKCKMITVFSNKGGIGKTSIASNLALELAKITKENVALIDLNFQFGDIATFMDIQPSFDISYMFDNLSALNKDFLLSTMEQYKGTSLYVLADAPYFKQSKVITAKQVNKFFGVLKETFSYIIVDTDTTLDEKTITTLDLSDMIFLVTIVNLPALRNCQRCLGLFDKLGYDKNKIQILINRYMENDDISLTNVETLLNKKIYWKIPNNYFALMAAINKGILLSELNPESNVAQSYKELAMNVSDSVFKTHLVQKFSPADNRRLENILEI